MNSTVKHVAKKIIYPTLDWLDVAIPPVTTLCVRRFHRYRAINDLRITKVPHYTPLGVYTTLYSQKPPYYKSFLKKKYQFDAQGLPMYLAQDGSFCYNPVMLASYGLAEYGYFLAGGEVFHRENCLNTAKAILQFQDERGGWPYNFDYYHHSMNLTMKSGWYSAMGQGQTISLLVRANSLEPDPAYREASHRALALLEIPVEEGGLLAKLRGGDFYEEYPTTPASFTLNGFIYCLIGLYDSAQVFQDEQAMRLFQRGMETLKAVLPLFDGDVLSCYDLSHLTNPPKRRLCDRKYHILHCELLRALEDIQHEDVQTFYISKWGKHWR